MIKLTIAIGLLVVGLLMFGGLWLFVKGARNVLRSVASTRWPQTEGTVVSSETTRSESPATRKSPASVTFSTRTVVRYNVGGREYTTDTISFGHSLGSNDKSGAALQEMRYPAGKTISVWYDPREPGTGVLKPGLHAEAFGLAAASLALLIPAVICLLVGPLLVRDTTKTDKAFQQSVEQAMADARRGVAPMPNFPPADPGGDRVMLIAATVFGLIFCGAGILMLNAGIQRIWAGTASVTWPKTGGVVVMASKGETDDEEITNDTSDTVWYARFVYRYTVAGTDHFNNLRRFAQVEGGGGPAEIERISTRYRKGAKVTVSYLPSDPDVAVLEPGNSSDNLWLPGIGLVALLFSAAVFIWVVPAMSKG